MELLVPLMWLSLALILLFIEATTFNLVTIWFAIGALVSMFLSIAFPEYYELQSIVFVVTSILMLITIRNIAVKKLKNKTIKTNVNALVGKKAVVMKTIRPYDYGQVKINDTYWTAKSENDEVIEVGLIVEIIEVSGVKVIVKKVD